MKRVYLVLAVLGAVLPFLFFIPFFRQQGLSLNAFVSTLFANGASAGIAVDLLVASVVFWIFMFDRRARLHGPSPYLFILINVLIGLGCAIPAYLYARET
ncbi:MAG TPA: DUF2834 domain-containing protein [Anaerolineales bacterium]|nr:DUF2834 domain-containing protein [Anaerolineales bacterium]